VVQIRSVEIKNFRCLRHVNIEFDSVTTLIGPNGGGKSYVLRALDWFFNGDKSALSEDDV
jgi:putative ATP-dependent endonuclease of OLD family